MPNAKKSKPSQPPGPELLSEYLLSQRKPGAGPPGFVFSISAWASSLGVSRQQIRMWRLGAVKPSPEHRAALEQVSGGQIPRSSWD